MRLLVRILRSWNLSPNSMIDTHCHVHFNAYKGEIPDIIQRSLDKGVNLITVGTQTDTSKGAIEWAEKYDGLWATIGLHPNHTCEQEFVDSNEFDARTKMVKTRCESFDVAYYRELASHPKVVAIGELGLDYYRIPEHLNEEEVKIAQEREVRAQLDLANDVDLPVVIHCRDAHADMCHILKKYIDEKKLERKGVVHCFTGTLAEAQKYHELGFLTSFTGIITFSSRKQEGLTLLQEVVRDVPLEMMMIETDSPYLAPEPHRGKRCEPWMVEFVAQKIAELKNISLEEVISTTTQNAEKLFGISYTKPL